MIYLLATIVAVCLASGQSLWGATVKAITASGEQLSIISLLSKVVVAPGFWGGVLLYVIGTGFYFVLLSQAKFFSIQFTMTGVALLIALAVSYFFFHESISALNMLGVLFIFVGIFLVMQR